MKTSLTSNLEPDAKTLVVAEFKGSSILRKHLRELLERRVNNKYAEMGKKDAYECSNWSYKQADDLGYIRSHKELISLLEN